MHETSNWLVHDHRTFEVALQECEIAAGAGEWKEATLLFYGFVEELKLHMRMEDEVVYPVFVEELGDAEGEIAELGEEHNDLVRLLTDMAAVIKHEDFDHFEESLPMLYRAMAEHNAHEEEVLKRMGSDSLLTRRAEILQRLEAMGPEAARVWEF